MRKFSQFKTIRSINEQDTNIFRTNVDEPQSDEQANEVAKSGPSKFISKILQSREMAQVYHWTVKGDMGSDAAHRALAEYYDGVIELIDQLVEVYQGQYGLIEGYDIIDTNPTKTTDRIAYFTSIAAFIKENRLENFSQEDTHLQNIIDEIVALIYRLLYKLKYNR